MKESQVKNRWGEILEITRDGWMSEVTDCSKSCWVVVLLYQSSVVQCQLLEEALIVLAPKFRQVKFTKIRSTQAVENWPDRNLPTLFVYHEGELKHQMMTLKAVGGNSMTADNVEWWLAERHIIVTDMEEPPRSSKSLLSPGSTVFNKTRATYSDEEDNDTDF